MESLPAVVTLLPKFTVTDERVSPYCLLGKSIKLSLRISTSWSSAVRLDIRTFPESSMRCSDNPSRLEAPVDTVPISDLIDHNVPGGVSSFNLGLVS